MSSPGIPPLDTPVTEPGDFDPDRVDLSRPIYATSPESQIQPMVGPGDDEDDEDDDFPSEHFDGDNSDLRAILFRLEEKIDVLATTQDGVRTGVNTIGEMMNSVAEMFDHLVQKVQSGGIGSLLGGLMGGKNNGQEG